MLDPNLADQLASVFAKTLPKGTRSLIVRGYANFLSRAHPL